MKLEDVSQRLTRIYNKRGDDERAHIDEDDLHQDVLSFIASECTTLEEARLLANEALKTRQIDFSRWHA